MQQRLFPWLLAVALLLPLCSERSEDGSWFGAPRTTSGDEPHYLLALYSVLEDGDLDLRNQYDRMRAGGPQGGARLAGTNLLRPQVDYATNPDYGPHGPGLPVLLAVLLFPLRHTALLESAAVSLSALAIVLAMLAFRALLTELGVEPRRREFVTVAAFLATPVWFYAKSLFCEPWLLLFTLGCCFLWKRGHAAASGALLALGMPMKPTCVLVAVPLLLVDLTRRDLRRVAALSAPLLVGAVVVGLQQQYAYGAFWKTPVEFHAGNPLRAAVGLWLSPSHGMLTIAPIFAAAAVGWVQFIRERHDACVFGWVFALQYALMCVWRLWEGGYCYGPRLMLPVLPLLALGLAAKAPWFEPDHRGRLLLHGLLALSVAIQVLAIFEGVATWSHHPLRMLLEPFL